MHLECISTSSHSVKFVLLLFSIVLIDFAKHFHRSITLTKSKSLDRGTEYPRRRKRFADMTVPSISLEELSLDNNNKIGLIRQRRLNSDGKHEFSQPTLDAILNIRFSNIIST